MIDERPIWRTVKIRAEDLREGDVTRNGFGKWDVVTSITGLDDVAAGALYISVHFEAGSTIGMRTVHLVDVQVVKPS